MRKKDRIAQLEEENRSLTEGLREARVALGRAQTKLAEERRVRLKWQGEAMAQRPDVPMIDVVTADERVNQERQMATAWQHIAQSRKARLEAAAARNQRLAASKPARSDPSASIFASKDGMAVSPTVMRASSPAGSAALS